VRGKPESKPSVAKAEFFDQPFGATLAVDNRRFPDSMNEILGDAR